MKILKKKSPQLIVFAVIFGLSLAFALVQATVRVKATSNTFASLRQDKVSPLGATTGLCGGIGFFQPPGSPYSAGNGSLVAAAGDFNLDGKPDVVFGNTGNFSSPNHTLTILLGNGQGGFSQAPGSPLTVGNGPISIAIADFNRDGKADLATAEIFSDQASILLGNGLGGFVHIAGSPLSINGIHPNAVTAGDFNQDDNPDLAIASTFFGQSRVAILLGDGTGQFTQADGSPVELAFNSRPIDIHMADLNLDGKDDLVTANLEGTLTTLLNNGKGGFTVLYSPVSSTQAPRNVVVGDFNLDGKPDLSVTATLGFVGEIGSLIILLGDGAGNFSAAAGSPYQTGDDPFDQVLADFNLDGFLDLAVLNNSSSNDIKILVGDGTGRFSPPPTSLFVVSDLPSSITAGDFNLDGRPDLAVGTYFLGQAVILLNSCPPVARCRAVAVAAGPACTANASVDDGSFDPDGDPITLTQSPPGPYPLGVTPVTLTVTNNGGESTSCQTSVTVIDNTPPTINSCPANITVSAAPNQCSATVNPGQPTAIDNCSSVLITGTRSDNLPLSVPYPKGVTTITWTARDVANNSTSCQQTVTVTDTQAPTITCPSPITRTTIANQCSATVSYTVQVSDNCPGVGVPICSPASGSAFPKGTTTVSCTVTDASNNQSSCSFPVTVNDIQAPAIVCPPNIIRTTARPGILSAAITYLLPAVTDNCSGSGVVCSPASGATFPVGVTTVTCVATDASGNRNQCSFTVTLFDVCLQDATDAQKSIVFNTQTGDYLFCCGTTRRSGRGRVSARGSIFTLDDTSTFDRVIAQVDATIGRGTATLQGPGGTCTVTDREIADNTCPCVVQP